MTIQNGNSDVERSLSDNKNTLRAERSRMSEGTLMGLRRIKERARSAKGAHNVNTLTKEIITSVKVAHNQYVENKKEEEDKKALLEFQKKKENEMKKKQEEAIKQAKKSQDTLNSKEKQLAKDQQKADEEFQIA